MGILGKLFGRRPRRPDPKRLLQTIQAFIAADTWAESRRILEQHPELLTDEADALLGQLLESNEVRRTSEREVLFCGQSVLY